MTREQKLNIFENVGGFLLIFLTLIKIIIMFAVIPAALIAAWLLLSPMIGILAAIIYVVVWPLISFILATPIKLVENFLMDKISKLTLEIEGLKLSLSETQVTNQLFNKNVLAIIELVYN